MSSVHARVLFFALLFISIIKKIMIYSTVFIIQHPLKVFGCLFHT